MSNLTISAGTYRRYICKANKIKDFKTKKLKMETDIKAAEYKSFTYSFTAEKSPEEVYSLLLNVEQWWSGIYEETIK